MIPYPNPKSQIYTLEWEITNSRNISVVLIWIYESPVLLKFNNSTWKHVVPYTYSCMAVSIVYSNSLQNIIIPNRTFFCNSVLYILLILPVNGQLYEVCHEFPQVCMALLACVSCHKLYMSCYLFNFVDYSCLQKASNHKLFFHFYLCMSNYLIMKLFAVTILLLILALSAESCKKVLLISCFNLRVH